MGKLGSFSNYLGRQRVSGHTNLRQKELRHYSKNKSAVVELVETDKLKKKTDEISKIFELLLYVNSYSGRTKEVNGPPV